MGQLGFGDEHTIVIHDADRGQYGARLWWMLDRLGHPSVFMLNGGLGAWRAAGGELTAERTSHLRAAMTLMDRWQNTIDREGVAASIDSIAERPTFFTAPSPKRIPSPSQTNSTRERLMSGGRSGMRSRWSSPIRTTTRSVSLISLVSEEARNSRG